VSNFGMELIGERKVITDLAGIAVRSVHLDPAFELAFRAQERAQRAPFAGGKLVDSGALRASLTQPSAAGAIREAHGTEAEFGTSISYAHAAAARAHTHALVEPVDGIAELFMTYIVEPTAL
jgi:hypothetical protein